ncbi:MAG: hypothetical protein FJZ57_01385 [Chlamydiae bacterium]|nr:hypothetical protein [Chlamydiota bacterium]
MSTITSISSATCEHISQLTQNASAIAIWMGKNVATIGQSAMEMGKAAFERRDEIAQSAFEVGSVIATHVAAVAAKAFEIARSAIDFAQPHINSLKEFIDQNRSYATVGAVGALVGIAAYLLIKNTCCPRQSAPTSLHV